MSSALCGSARVYGTRAGGFEGAGAGRDSLWVVDGVAGAWLCEISAAMPIDVAPARMRTGMRKTNMGAS